MLTVTITKEHYNKDDIKRGTSRQYCDPFDCPLFRALREQHPNFKFESIGIGGNIALKKAGGDSLCSNEGFDHWNAHVSDKLFDGRINSVTLTYNI